MKMVEEERVGEKKTTKCLPLKSKKQRKQRRIKDSVYSCSTCQLIKEKKQITCCQAFLWKGKKKVKDQKTQNKQTQKEEEEKEEEKVGDREQGT